jgi:hypothetical protein
MQRLEVSGAVKGMQENLKREFLNNFDIFVLYTKARKFIAIHMLTLLLDQNLQPPLPPVKSSYVKINSVPHIQ